MITEPVMHKQWYEAAFGADYLERYSHRSEEEADGAVDLFLRRTRLAEGARVMDLCCGAGRHVFSFRRRGFPAVGLDLSMDLLRAARELPGARDVPPACLVRADKRWHPFPAETFHAVTHFFTAFGYFQEDAENYAVFDEVRRVLKPDGWYLFDFMSAPLVIAEFDGRDEIRSEESDGDVRIVSTRRLTDGGLRVEKHMEFLRDDRVFRELHERVRLFRPEDLLTALDARGFALAETWGDNDGGPWRGEHSPRWIALSKRRPTTSQEDTFA